MKDFSSLHCHKMSLAFCAVAYHLKQGKWNSSKQHGKVILHFLRGLLSFSYEEIIFTKNSKENVYRCRCLIRGTCSLQAAQHYGKTPKTKGKSDKQANFSTHLRRTSTTQFAWPVRKFLGISCCWQIWKPLWTSLLFYSAVSRKHTFSYSYFDHELFSFLYSYLTALFPLIQNPFTPKI